MTEMTDEEFQALVQQLLSVKPRDEVAWKQFCEMFEPAIRFHARISGGHAPLLQGLLDTQDLVDSVWRRSLAGNWAERFVGMNVRQVGRYFVKAARMCLLEKLRP